MMIGKLPDGSGRRDVQPHEYPEWMQREIEEARARSREARMWERIYVALIALVVGASIVGGLFAADSMLQQRQQQEAQP